MDDEDAQCQVGYRNPPRETRFKKGVSGNQSGRPKGSKNLATVVLKESRERVRINGPRGTKTVTKLEATVKQIGNKSAQGDLRASREFLNLIQRSEEQVTSGGDPLALSELDREMIESLRHRMSTIEPTKPTTEIKKEPSK
jgi:hypothetical protein